MPLSTFLPDAPVKRENTSQLQSSSRVAWVDVSRVLVMFGTVLTHAPLPRSWEERLWFTSAGRMCLLFAFAGYFMARRCLPGVRFPQWGRVKRMAAAYVLLVVVYVLCLGWSPYWHWQDLSPLTEGSWGERLDVLRRLFGLGDYPPGPLWFLRDLLVLTLACGFFAQLGRRGWLYPLAVACLCLGWEDACHRFELGGYQVIHPREIAFFCIGVALTGAPLARIAAWLKRWSVPIVAAALFLLWYEPQHWRLLTPVGILAYMGLSMAAALWLERIAPKAAKLVARLGETVFFVYVLHMLLIDLLLYYLHETAGVEPEYLPPWLWLLLVPILYLLIHFSGMALKKRLPELFELLAIRAPKERKPSLASGLFVPEPHGRLEKD